MQPSILVPVNSATDVSAARRQALNLSAAAGCNAEAAAEIGIVVTEAATNVLKHAGSGEIVLRREGSRIEIVALDRGAGIANSARCFEDGYSTAGTQGNGLGAIARLSAFHDLYSVPGIGTVLVAHVGGVARHGVMNVPYPGETTCGDSWIVQQTSDRLRILVIDGLGHGVAAAEAARTGISVAESKLSLQPAELLEAAHAQLRSTRGAAASVADVRAGERSLEFSGIGNVAGIIAPDALSRRQMISGNGTLGHEVRKVQQFSYPLAPRSLVVLQSDGLSANWSFDKYPGLFTRHPSVIAAVLFRDFRRHRDDATIVVVRVEGINA